MNMVLLLQLLLFRELKVHNAFSFLTGRAQAARSNVVDFAITHNEELGVNLRLTRAECRSERCTVKARLSSSRRMASLPL
jgi:hypothetical protein